MSANTPFMSGHSKVKHGVAEGVLETSNTNMICVQSGLGEGQVGDGGEVEVRAGVWGGISTQFSCSRQLRAKTQMRNPRSSYEHSK